MAKDFNNLSLGKVLKPIWLIPYVAVFFAMSEFKWINDKLTSNLLQACIKEMIFCDSV